MEDILGVALRVSVTYLYILALMRLTGKRSLGDISPIDLVVAFVVGDMLDNIFFGNVPLANGVLGLSVVVILHALVAYGSFRSKRFEHLVSGRRTLLVTKGELVGEQMRRERLNEEEVKGELRLRSVEDLGEIKEAGVEPSGTVSVLLTEEAKPADRRDLRRVVERVR